MTVRAPLGRLLTTSLVAGALAVAGLAPIAAGAAVADPPPPPRPPRASGPLSERLQRVVPLAERGAPAEEQAIAASVAPDGPGSLLRRPDGRLVVEVRAADVGPATAAAVEAAGGHVVSRTEALHVLTVEVPPDRLPAVAAVRGVEHVDEVLTPEVAGTGVSPTSGATTNATCPSGVVSEGDAQLQAATARATYGVDGTGVRVGVLSDSYNDLSGAPADVAAGELPGATNPCGYTTDVTVQADMASGGADEGRAMSQIVHDLAPGSPITYATAFNGPADFAGQITTMAAGGAKVIVDDITYYNEPMYQDGVIAKAVQDANAAGVTYFSSAANSTVVVGGKSVGSYEAPAYRPTPCPASVVARGEVDCHDFDPGVGTDPGDNLTVPTGKTLRMSLGYNEPQYGVTTDLDLYLLDSGGNVVAQSESNNPGNGAAYEFISYTNSTGSTQTYRLVVGRFSGSATPRLKVVFHRGPFTAVQWNTSTGGDVIGPTAFGHNIARFGTSVAAVPYNSTTTVEGYSSRGPATYCWGPVVGTSPAAALASCETRTIDVAATDGTANSFFGSLSSGVWRFFGTSAAAPHAAAVAALQRQKAPCRTPAEVLAAQKASAHAVGSFGVDDAGAGLLDANAAIAAQVGCTAQTLSWTTAPPAGIATGLTFPVAATSTAGLPVTIAATGSCSGGGTGAATITAGAVGVCTLTLTQAGNPTYAPGLATTNVSVVATSGALLSLRTAGGGGSDLARSVKVDAAGNTYVTGRFEGSATFGTAPATATLVSAGNTDGYLARYNPDGSLAWAQRFGSTGMDEGWDVALDASGNPVITGGFSGSVTFGSGPSAQVVSGVDDLFVAKLTPTGALTWIRTATGTGIDRGLGVTVDAGGYVGVTGAFLSSSLTFAPGVTLTNAGGVDGFVARYGPSGNLWWARPIAGTGSDLVRGVAALPSGALAVAGFSDAAVTVGTGGPVLANAGGNDGFVAVVGPAGTTLWADSIKGAGLDLAWGVATDGSGNVYVAGLFTGAGTVGSATAGWTNVAATASGTDALVVRLTGTGSVTWARPLGGTSGDGALGVAVGSSAVRVVGSTGNGVDGDGAMWTLDLAGTLQSTLPVGTGTGDASGQGVALDAAGNPTVAGMHTGTATFGTSPTARSHTSAGADDIFLARFGT